MNKDEISTRVSKARVVAMCGISGSGKTVFSKSLEKYGFIRLSADEAIWEKYGARFTELHFETRKEIFQRVDMELAEKIESLLADGHKVVVDSTMCKRTKRDAMRSLCSEIGTEPLFIYLDAPIEVLRQRLAGRTGTGPNDQIIDSRHLEMFYKNFERPESDEKVMVIKQ